MAMSQVLKEIRVRWGEVGCGAKTLKDSNSNVKNNSNNYNVKA